jgi:hypothetical protein
MAEWWMLARELVPNPQCIMFDSLMLLVAQSTWIECNEMVFRGISSTPGELVVRIGQHLED